MADAEVVIKLSLEDDASKSTKRAAKDMNRSISQMGKAMTKSFIAASLTVNAIRFAIDKLGDAISATGSAIKSSVSGVIEFEASLVKIKNVAGMTISEMEALNDAGLSFGENIRNMSVNSIYSTNAISAGFYELGAIGNYTRGEMESMMGAILPLSTATGTTLATSVQVAAMTMNQFGYSAEEAIKVANILTATANMSALEMNEIGIAMQYAASTAKSMGYSLEETSAMLAILSNRGFTASTAGTSLRRAMNRIIKPSAAAYKQLRRLSIQTEDSEGNFLSMSNIINQLAVATRDKTSADKASIIATIFGINAANSILALMDEQIDSSGELTYNIEELTEEFGEFTGMLEQADAASKTAEGQMANLLNVVAELSKTFGSAVIGEFFTVDESGMSPLMEFSEVLKGMKPTLERIGEALNLAFGALAPIVEPMIGLVESILNIVAAAIESIAGKGEDMMGGVGKGITDVSTAIAGGEDDMARLVNAVMSIVDSLLTGLTPAFELIGALVGDIMSFIIEFVILLGNLCVGFEAVGAIVSVIVGIFISLINMVLQPLLFIVKAINKQFELFGGAAEQASGLYKMLADQVLSLISAFNFLEIGGKIINGIFIAMEGFLYNCGQSFEKVQEFVDSLRDGFQTLIDMGKGLIDMVSDLFGVLSPHGAVCLKEALWNATSAMQDLNEETGNFSGNLSYNLVPSVRDADMVTGEFTGSMGGGGVAGGGGGEVVSGGATGGAAPIMITNNIEGGIRNEDDLENINNNLSRVLSGRIVR